ncbi:MAG: NAD(P)-dependent oxidoreductase [Bacteroidales bacterium]|nr:NAD(P)-dependent oxidoreductase [Bacteroidales bacterium]
MLFGIIGSDGFIANSIGSRLNLINIEVNVFGKRHPQYYRCRRFHQTNLEINKFPFEEFVPYDIIFYVAAIGVQAGKTILSKDLYYVNSYFPTILSEFLKEKGSKCKLITFGSYFEIGNNDRDVYFHEKEVVFSDLPVPNNYCLSKRLLSRYISSLNSSYSNIHFILPTIYGETEQNHRLIPYLVNSIIDKKEIQLTSGEQIRQYLYEKDFSEILLDIILNDKVRSGIHNFPEAETLSVREVAGKVLTFFGLTDTMINFGAEQRQDISMKVLKLRNTLSHNVVMKKIEDALPEYVNFYNKSRMINESK